MNLIDFPSSAASVEFVACSRLGRVETLPVERSASTSYVATFVEHMLPVMFSDVSWSLTLLAGGFAAHVTFDASVVDCRCEACVGGAVVLCVSWLTAEGVLLSTEVRHVARDVEFVAVVEGFIRERSVDAA